MFGVYLHFPYCRKRCPYCDFAVHARPRIPHEAYADAVCRELSLRAPLFAGRALVSVYFGGGTPSRWDPACVARALSAVRGAFGASDVPLEVTLEANPDDALPETLARLRAAGVNRLSLGAQSFDPAQLRALGRLHGPEATRVAVAAARAAAFDNLSLDLMYGLPRQTLAGLAADLDAALALQPEHFSIYQLTIEPRTAFGAYLRRGELSEPDPETAAAMAELVAERTRAAGFVRYEVSSYARPGRRSVHNGLYWGGGEWLGLGSAAHSFRWTGGGAGERWSTLANVDEYLRRVERARPGEPLSGGLAPSGGLLATHEPLDAETLAREAIWLGLRRLDEGVDRRAYAARFGFDPAARFSEVLGTLVAGRLVETTETALRLTPRGALLADEIAQRFL